MFKVLKSNNDKFICPTMGEKSELNLYYHASQPRFDHFRAKNQGSI